MAPNINIKKMEQNIRLKEMAHNINMRNMEKIISPNSMETHTRNQLLRKLLDGISLDDLQTLVDLKNEMHSIPPPKKASSQKASSQNHQKASPNTWKKIRRRENMLSIQNQSSGMTINLSQSQHLDEV